MVGNMAVVQKTGEPGIAETKRRQAQDIYIRALRWVKDGEFLLHKGLQEKRAGNFTEARRSMGGALKHFREAIDRYECALQIVPPEKMRRKLQRKIDGLQNCDIACANNAIRHMEPKTEPISKSKAWRSSDIIARHGGLI